MKLHVRPVRVLFKNFTKDRNPKNGRFERSGILLKISDNLEYPMFARMLPGGQVSNSTSIEISPAYALWILINSLIGRNLNVN